MARDVDTLYAVVPTEWTERGMETVRSINVHVSCANGSYTYQDLKKDQWGWVGPTVTSKIEKMRAGEKKDRGKLRLVSPDHVRHAVAQSGLPAVPPPESAQCDPRECAAV